MDEKQEEDRIGELKKAAASFDCKFGKAKSQLLPIPPTFLIKKYP